MKKKYELQYGVFEASATFIIDTSKFTNELAQSVLEFFTWDYDKEADPIDEAVKKYALKAIVLASFEHYDYLQGVINEFEEIEGFAPVDGSYGITLLKVDRIEIEDSQLSIISKQDI
ncbi:DUF2528 family protein [Flammeovirga aprica]|uniref:DUF2528 family protein n=1 Tax=Flammeovirga aprica JL-4 TaxID=694437 RepID=A0A7X9P0Q6_9BACT|nr:DUF2528 family protein [Flammeovirga aprica]NME67190.1 DUF2528 family protein [Flammeovirga aprica JL-4]